MSHLMSDQVMPSKKAVYVPATQFRKRVYKTATWNF